MLTVQVLDEAAFASRRTEWNQLAGGIPFRRWEWCSSWWEHYGQGHQLFVLAVQDRSNCIGIAPFYIVNQEPLGRVLRIMGDGEVCGDYLSILARAADRQRVATTIADWLKQQNDSRQKGNNQIPHWELMELDGMDSECLAFQHLLQKLATNGFAVHQSTKVNTWQIPLPPTMEAYASSLSKQSRRKIRTAVKRFTGGDCSVVTTPVSESEFGSAWERLIELHQRRRNSLGDPGCFASCAFSEFLLDAASAFRETGHLDLIQVSIDGWTVATELCFRGTDTLFAYQLGIEPNALKENPGWLVNAAAIQHAISRGMTSFDLCRGDEQYKHHLGASPRPSMRCRVVPSGIRSHLWNAAIIGQSTIKNWVKAGLNVVGARP